MLTTKPGSGSGLVLIGSRLVFRNHGTVIQDW